MKRIASQSLADQARDQIREAIFEGKIRPEERLTIEQIAAELGSSRTPVREALKALEASGFVRILPNRGAIVQRFDKQEIYDRYAMRALLEGYAGEMACRARGLKIAEELEENCRAMELKLQQVRTDDLHDTADLLKLNMVFHQRIRESSGSAIVCKLLDMLEMPVAYRLYYWREQGRRQALLQFHKDVVAAFRSLRPKKVRRLLEKHILDSRDYLLAGK